MRILLVLIMFCCLVFFLTAFSEARRFEHRCKACDSTKECPRCECCVTNPPPRRGKRSIDLFIPTCPQKKGTCMRLGTIGHKCYMHTGLRGSKTYGEFCPCKRRLSCTQRIGGKGQLGICAKRPRHGGRHGGRHRGRHGGRHGVRHGHSLWGRHGSWRH